MAAVSFWLGHTLRRRWVSLVVIAVLVAIATTVVLTAASGARRGASSSERLTEQTLAADVAIVPNMPGVDWTEVEKLPYVKAVHQFSLGASPVVDGIEDGSAFFYPGDDNLFSTIEKSAVIEGRLPNPLRDDEVVITPLMASVQGKKLGDSVTIHLPGPGQFADWMVAPKDLNGPVVKAKIVGVVRGGFWLGFWEGPGGHGLMILSPGIYAQHAEAIGGPLRNGVHPDGVFNAMVRLANPDADRAKLKADLEKILGRPDVDLIDGVDGRATLQRTLNFEAGFLLAFAAAALVASCFLIGQALSRFVSSILSDLEPSAALGMTPRQRVAAAVGTPLAATAVGGLVGLGLSAYASRWFPIGSASYNEPNPGTSVDLMILLAGGALLTALALLATIGPALWAMRVGGPAGSDKSSGVAATVGRLDAPIPVQVGVRHALEAGRGRDRVPSRPALLGAIAGVTGAAAALTFAYGVNHAVDRPELFGETFQAGTSLGEGGEEFAPGLGHMATEWAEAVDETDTVTVTRIGIATDEKSDTPVEMWSFDPDTNHVEVVVTDGRAPETADEVLLTPGILDRTDAEVGDTIEIAGSQGSEKVAIVGEGFKPSAHADYNHGGWIPDAGYDRLFKDDFKYLQILVGSDSASAKDLVAALNKQFPAEFVEQGMEFYPNEGTSAATAQAQLREVRRLPQFLAGFLGLMAVAAVGHVLVTSVRRRRHDLAVLRALGTTPSQSRGIVLIQAAVVSLVGVGVGLPLGVALGRTLWRQVAAITPFEYVAPATLLPAALTGLAALALAQLLAVLPAHRASRLRVATVLRAE